MKIGKTQTCIYIYEQLLKNNYLDISETKNKFNLEDKTFLRYVNEIRSYLYNFYKGRELVYVRSNQCYKLISFSDIDGKK